MDFLQVLKQRNSIRQFTSQPVSREQIEQLKQAILLAPSSKARYPCHFYFVKDPSSILQLAACKPHGADFLRNAPLVIVFTADPAISDVWTEDTAIATTYAMLQIVNIGLAGCWVQVRNRMYDDQVSSEDYIKKILHIDEPLRVLSMLGVGYPAEPPKMRNENFYSNFTIIG